MKKFIFKLISIILIIITMIVFIFNLVLFTKSTFNKDNIPDVCGYKFFIVMSGSMKSKINIGDLVIVKKVEPKTLNINDIIAFRDAKNIVTTHRIIDIINKENDVFFETKGDNNNIKDNNLVKSNMIEGIYIVSIPKLGELILFVQKPLGFIMLLILILVMVSITFIIESKENIKKDKEYLKEFEEFKKQKELENSRK